MSNKSFKIIFELFRKQYPTARLYNFERYYVLTINNFKTVFESQTLCVKYLERRIQ